MSELKKYYVIDYSHDTLIYDPADVDARLAADAERITHLCERLEIANRRLSLMQAKYESEED